MHADFNVLKSNGNYCRIVISQLYPSGSRLRGSAMVLIMRHCWSYVQLHNLNA